MTGQPVRVAELAAELGRSFEGDGEVELGDVAALEAAGPGDLVFVRSERYAPALAESKASAAIAPPGVEAGGRPVIRSPNPGLDFARAARRLHPAEAREAGLHPSSFVDSTARVDPSAAIGPCCVVGRGAVVGAGSVLHANVSLYPGVEVGSDCVLHAGCVLREGVRIGDRVVLQPGVVLGAEGFGYVTDEAGRLESTPQIGRVVVEDDVEIGANSAVDRGSLGETRIRRGAKIDNLVQIGHNCDVGEDSTIIGQAGLSGSVTLGRGVLVMAQAGIADHVKLGERAYVAPRAGVMRDVPAGSRVALAPAEEYVRAGRVLAIWRKLPELAARLRAVERHLGLGRRGGGADQR